MGSEWHSCKLGDLVDIKHGFAFKSENFSDEPTNDILLTPGNFAIGGGFKYGKLKYYSGEILTEFILQPGDLLVTMTDLSKQSDTLGYPAFIPDTPGKRYLHNQRLGLVQIRSDAPLEKFYLYYLMCSREYRHEIIASATGTTVKHTAPNRIKAFAFLLPCQKEQRAIAHILGSLDDKIELNRQMNETLEAMAQAIFKSWFVDFDPVRAKAEGRDPGLPNEIADLFPDSFEDSELGEIPSGWKVFPISHIAYLDTQTVYPINEPNKIWEHYSIPAYDEGKLPIFEPGERIKSGKYMVPNNSVLASKLNPQFPRVWLYDVIEQDSAICSTEFMPFVPKNTNWRSFLYELLRSQPVQDKIISRVTGSTGSRQRVKPKEIAILPIIEPLEALMDIFSNMVSSLHKKKLCNIRESCFLSTLRNTLLPKLISGELRVPDAEKFIKEAGL